MPADVAEDDRDPFTVELAASLRPGLTTALSTRPDPGPEIAPNWKYWRSPEDARRSLSSGPERLTRHSRPRDGCSFRGRACPTWQSGRPVRPSGQDAATGHQCLPSV